MSARASSGRRGVLVLTTADTEVLATLAAAERLPAAFGPVRALNPTVPGAPGADELLDAGGAGPAAVLVRLLGGRRAWEGFDRLAERCRAEGVPLLAFSGEAAPDAELAACSTAPAGALAQAFEYLRHGGVDNLANLLRFVADTQLGGGLGFEPPVELPEEGYWHPRAADPSAVLDPARPTVGVVFYRAHWMSGNTGFVAALVDAVEAAGGNALPVFCYSLRPGADGRVGALELLAGRVDALVVTVLAMGGSSAAPAEELAAAWEVPALEALGVPVLQGLCATGGRAAWAASSGGLSPLDAAMQVAIPEFDGRIVSVPFSFKEPLEATAPAGRRAAPAAGRYVADPERAARVAGTALKLARLRRTPNAAKRVAIVLSNYPTRHSRVGNAVGLDTPASAVRLLDALTAAGYDTGDWAARGLGGDALVHELIATGGFDAEFLTEPQLARNPARVAAGRHAAWFARLPAELRAAVVAAWGEPPGELYVDDQAGGRGGGELVFPSLSFGNVLVAIQPPRGFGENPVAIYHDPALPPTHHYLACYRWLEEVWGAHALVHLGKHGTLEWLPGKGLGLSASCAPDAVLGDLPLVYPFVVNDPGEGTQAKRRAHAVIVDHLVPPMTRAETYDELTRLEQLLDEHYQLQTTDPAKAPALRGEIWQLLRSAELTRDLALADRGEAVPDDLDDIIVRVDGYLCEIKDLQIRGGLHVLGQAPRGEDRLGLVLAILRLPQPLARPTGRAGAPGPRTLPGLRSAVGAAFGLDEAGLLAAPGEAVEVPAALLARFPGPGRTGADALDRLEDAARALAEAMDAAAWEPAAAGWVAGALLDGSRAWPAPGDRPWAAGRAGGPRVAAEGLPPDVGTVAEVLAFAAAVVVPRLEATGLELERVLDALAGRYVPAGPSGSPTRGRVDALPTGRNFYSVDPKALPSELAWQVGQRLAADLLARYEREEGRPPSSIGLVVWGTSAMRTHGDDVAEVLALLGVRPRWHPETRRVTGLELMSLAELGRPRVDVTVRISGFFRDAFPHLVALLDDAVALVAGLDEPEDANPVAASARRDEAALVAAGVDGRAARRRATARVFGSKPGAYGAGLLPLIDARTWRTDADLAEVYAVWGGYAYGRELDGAESREDMERAFRRIQVAVKNQDTREHDLVDSDDYFQYHGGMVASVRALTGTAPRAYLGDSADPARVRTRDLREETARVFRARVANPKWIRAMRRHGYKGAFELAATVDYLFGYDATAAVVEDWMYETLAARYVFDPEVREFMERANPWALRAIAERLLEAAERGLWAKPRDATVQRLRETYLDLEGDLEERG
ncbi:MAG TPA: cobaltochelatase subunit CobN [Actinomycetes bacterium]|nr:cobaltochelatase subunit CobN [Actinomycetes bacterium]